MRDAFSKVIAELGRKDPDILLITGDHGYSLFDEFRRECPSQYINAGIAEQNMVGIAAGLARSGFRPIVYGLSAFIPIRVLEQIKLDVAHDNLPIIFIGDGAGFVYSHLGTSHQSNEDIACSCSIPNLSVFSPADKFEFLKCFYTAYKCKSSVYIRLGKADRGHVHNSIPNARLGDLINIKPITDPEYSIISTGSMVKASVDILEFLDCKVDVWSVPFIKPINVSTIDKICKSRKAIIIIEEHSKYGGLGSIVAELSSALSPIKILHIAVNDQFSDKCGTYEYLLKENGMDNNTILKKIRNFLQNYRVK